MCMHDLPVLIDLAKEQGLLAPAVELVTAGGECALDRGVCNGPCETVVFKVDVYIREAQFEVG